MNQKTWMVQRAVIAICLLVGFYALALGMALGLLWIPYAEWTYAGTVHFKLLAVCVGFAGAILWAVIPRSDKFEPPGPVLDEYSHPDLFRVIEEAAAGTQQSMPSEVYLLNEVNAFVTYRGGVMGFGSHRVMGIGLPLLQALTVPELKAVIAHEFGHYHSGDVALGPWIYKTRAAIVRTVAGVRDTWFEFVFVWYGRQFLKVTHAVSRQQEFIADAMAAKLYGPDAMAGALRRTAALGPIFMTYVGQEVMPVLHAGFLPPLATGFDTFLQAERVVATSAIILSAAESGAQADPFDTHPTLRERLDALAVNEKPVPTPRDPALRLIVNADRLGLSLIEHALGTEASNQLKPIAWQQVGAHVYEPNFRSVTKEYAQLLSRFTADSLPVDSDAFINVGTQMVHRDQPEANINSEYHVGRATFVFGAAIGALLLDRGWHSDKLPGQPVVFARDGATLEPFAIMRALADGTMPAETWKQQCGALGIAGHQLGRLES